MQTFNCSRRNDRFIRKHSRSVEVLQFLHVDHAEIDLCLQKPVNKVKELNPYWKNDGVGLPTGKEKVGMQPTGSGRLPPPPGVGDGGASWRMKALKRAQEQAAREGRKLDEVQEADTKLRLPF